MYRTFAAWTGCLLMLVASWAPAMDGDYAPIPPVSGSGRSAAPAYPTRSEGGTPEPVAADSGLLGSLPDLGGPAYATLTRADETQIGISILKQFRDANLLLEDPEVDDYLQTLGMRLASQAHDQDQTFHYVAMRDGEVNSFATFGGLVCIFTGLILTTQTEAELAAVMAHETGHVVQRHMARDVEAQSHISLASTAAMLGAILIGLAGGRGGNGEAMEGAIAMAQATALQKSINFTRGEEVEADYVGIQLLAAAGYDPYEMATFFEAMSRIEGLSGSEIPALLIDHPVTSERIAVSRARAAQYPRLKAYAQSQSYPFIKERVRVLAATPETRLGLYYADLRAHRALTPAERYGEALVQIQSGSGAAAVPVLRELQNSYPELTLLYSALGQALAAAGQPEAALAQFARSEELFPRNAPLTVHYAETLMKAGDPRQAHALLLDLFNNVDPTPPQIQLTALAASAAGDSGDAYYYMGEYNLANGQLALANQELELALAAPDLSNIQRARYRARQQQVRDWMREQQQASRHGG